METFIYLQLKEIQQNPYQPRFDFSQEKLEELANSIRENGVIQPIIVRKSPIIGYELLAGERRFRAAKLAGLQEIPALVKDLTDQEMMEQAIIENLQRDNLNPIEEATSYQHLIDKGLTHEEIARIMGKSRPYISNIVRLLHLSEPVLTSLQEEKISQAHARLLLKFSSDEQETWLDKILKEEISVRKLEKLIKQPLQKSPRKKERFIQEEEEKLKKRLGTNVSIHANRKQAGYIKISFSDQEEYQRIINSLK